MQRQKQASFYSEGCSEGQAERSARGEQRGRKKQQLALTSSSLAEMNQSLNSSCRQKAPGYFPDTLVQAWLYSQLNSKIKSHKSDWL